MVIHMNDSQLTTLDQVQAFLTGTAVVVFTPPADDAARYRFIAAVLARFGYARLGRTDKGLIRRYLMHTTGYSRAQIARLLRQFRDTRRLVQRYAAPRAGFTRRYTEGDVRLLAEVDSLRRRRQAARRLDYAIPSLVNGRRIIFRRKMRS